ncbi:MAG: carbon-nitrogen hydrolase family protein [Proteobacteria bacterium]|nr:carbon-nitrogen hydrolase family protein [Pseudomonadota bacterium]
MSEHPNIKHPLLAAIQLNSSDKLEENLNTVFIQLKAAKQNGAACAVLPENFAWLGDEDKARHTAETEGHGQVQEFLSQSASELDLWIIGGSHRIIAPDDNNSRVTNTTLVYNPDGTLAARYDKIHLFDAEVNDGIAYCESATIKGGESLVVVDLGFTRVGLSICYDIRFPELYQALRNKGAEIIVVPSAFTVPTGRAHWQPLLRARAIENQVYIIAPAQCGTHSNGRKTWGHSLCIDPWGEIIDQLENRPGSIYCPFDADSMNELRKQMPVADHHRLKAANAGK